MKERPILFNGDMVRAILDGSKTQTRRIAKLTDSGRVKMPGRHFNWHCDDPNAWKASPYGTAGDRLWVRETHIAYEVGHICYRADYKHDPKGEKEHGVTWTPSIHMPRWASRITLEIIDVRVERLQNISPEDAVRDGARDTRPHDPLWDCAALQNFRQIWESCYGKESWSANPLVWVVGFKRIDATEMREGKQ